MSSGEMGCNGVDSFDLGGIRVTHPAGLRPFDWPGQPRFVTTLNAELVLLSRREPAFRDFLRGNVVTVDGQWTLWAAQRKRGTAAGILKQSGFDLLWEAAEACRREGRRIFVLGAGPESNARAVERLAELAGDEVVSGYSPPPAPFPFPEDVDGPIRQRIAEARPDVLVIAFGAPKQEYWARDHAAWLREMGVSWVLFLGGAVDMLAGKYRRAPRFVRRLGLESPYRLLQAPGRWKREFRKLQFLGLFLAGKL